MKVYTAQYRYSGKDRLDITVKSGHGAFCPTWKMVWGYKQGRITEQEYTEQYRDMMLRSRQENAEAWNELLAREKVVLVCFCRPGVFCHRVLLARMLEEFFGAEYGGELEI